MTALDYNFYYTTKIYEWITIYHLNIKECFKLGDIWEFIIESNNNKKKNY